MEKNNYVVGFKGKSVNLFDYTGKIIRRFTVNADVVNAQINGSGRSATIAITMKDGKFIVYRSDGTIVRKS